MGSPPLSPMVDIWGRNLKGRNASPSNHDPSYGPGVLPVIDPFGGASHHMPLNFRSESNNEVNILGWEAKCDTNTASILVLGAPNIIKQTEFQGFLMMFYDVPEASNKYTFGAR